MSPAEKAARLFFRELHRGGYAQTWEHASPSTRQGFIHAAETLLNGLQEAL